MRVSAPRFAALHFIQSQSEPAKARVEWTAPADNLVQIPARPGQPHPDVLILEEAEPGQYTVLGRFFNTVAGIMSDSLKQVNDQPLAGTTKIDKITAFLQRNPVKALLLGTSYQKDSFMQAMGQHKTLAARLAQKFTEGFQWQIVQIPETDRYKAVMEI